MYFYIVCHCTAIVIVVEVIVVCICIYIPAFPSIISSCLTLISGTSNIISYLGDTSVQNHHWNQRDSWFRNHKSYTNLVIFRILSIT